MTNETLSILADGEISGRDLRASLSLRGIVKSGPAFYHAMSRLEDDKLVRGWYREETIDEHTVKIRFYAITELGRACLEAKDVTASSYHA